MHYSTIARIFRTFKTAGSIEYYCDVFHVESVTSEATLHIYVNNISNITSFEERSELFLSCKSTLKN